MTRATYSTQTVRLSAHALRYELKATHGKHAPVSALIKLANVGYWPLGVCQFH